jgi:aspartyl-tRNA(Asn)/glutamyl-tRNA(Gln) amidotransferase subunit A
MFTQPISFAGLPVVSAPCHAAGELPVGVQVIGAPGDEAGCFVGARCIEGASFDVHGSCDDR